MDSRWPHYLFILILGLGFVVFEKNIALIKRDSHTMIILLHPYWQHLLQCYEYRFETRFDLSNGTEYLGTGLFRRTVLRCFGVLKKKDIYIYIYIFL